MQLYLCDNCGKATDKIYTLKAHGETLEKHLDDVVLGEFCPDCFSKIEKTVKEGIN